MASQGTEQGKAVRFRRGRKALWVGAATMATLGAAWAVYQEAVQPAPLETLLPESTFAFASGDGRWVWNATADLRQGPQIRSGLAGVEKELGISIEKDVMPWAGQVAGAALSIGPKNPQFAVLIEVRDPVQYYMSMTRLRTRIEHGASRYWKGTGYSGVPLRYTYIGSGRGRMPVSTAWLKGWLVVGIGNGTTKRIIDTWQNRKPALACNSAWTSTLSKLPDRPVMRFAMNTGMLVHNLPPGMDVSLSSAVMDMSRAVTAGAMTELDDGFRMVSATLATSSGLQEFYGRLGRVPAVNQEILDRLPDGTFLSMALADPGAWWDAYRPMLTSFAEMDPKNGQEAKEFLDAAVDRYKPVEEIVRRCQDGLALGLVYRPEQGFGLSIVGNCGTMETAQQSADDLREFVQRFDQMVNVSEDRTTYRLMMKDTGKAPIPFRPAWAVQGQYLTLGSHEAWLAPGTGAERFPLPDEALGAQTVARGDFRFVEPLLTQFPPAIGVSTGPKGAAKGSVKGAAKAPDKEALIQAWRRSGLGDARWWSASTIHPDGATEGVGELRGWNWRAALRTVVEQQKAAAAPKRR